MSEIPAEMAAIGIKEAGGPEMLEPQQRPVPKPGAGEKPGRTAPASSAPP